MSAIWPEENDIIHRFKPCNQQTDAIKFMSINIRLT